MKQSRTEILREVCLDRRVLLINGHDGDVVGTIQLANEDTQRLVYDMKLMEDRLMKKEGFTRKEAQEYIDFNYACDLPSEGCPVTIDYTGPQEPVSKALKSIGESLIVMSLLFFFVSVAIFKADPYLVLQTFLFSAFSVTGFILYFWSLYLKFKNK